MTLSTMMNGKPIRRDVERMVLRFGLMKEGETIMHPELRGLCEDPANGRYERISLKARRVFCDEHPQGVLLLSVPSVGLRWPSGMEQMHASRRIGKQGVKKIKRAHDVVRVIGDERLTPAGREARDFCVTRERLLVEMMKTEHKAVAVHVRKAEALPQG